MKEMYRDQFGEFVCGYWGSKGQDMEKNMSANQRNWERGSSARFAPRLNTQFHVK